MKNNILVIKHGALGDIILAGPAMQAIREFHKQDYIVCLTGETYFDMIKESPYFDEVIIDLKPKWSNLKGWLNLKILFKEFSFSHVYDLQTSYRSNIYFYLFFSLSKTIWSGIAYGSKYRHSNSNRKRMHTYDRQKDQLKLCGIEYDCVPNWNWLSKNYINKSLLPNRDFAIIITGAAAHRTEKKWPKASYASLITDLSHKGIISVLLGSLLEKEYIAEIIDMAENIVPDLKPKNYAGKTNFQDIVYLSNFTKFAIGNDTGPMHLIASTNIRTLVLFGNDSNPKLCAPIGGNVKVIQKKNIKCIELKEVIKNLL